jgi:hypothetical protein
VSGYVTLITPKTIAIKAETDTYNAISDPSCKAKFLAVFVSIYIQVWEAEL